MFFMGKKELSLFQSIFAMKCPRCRRGDLFSTKSSFDYKHLAEMPKACPVCAQSYLPEPGFYYGAMFVSYGISGVFGLSFVGICMLGFDLSVDASFITLIIIVAILFGWLFRISRSIWIHINIKYKPSLIQQK